MPNTTFQALNRQSLSDGVFGQLRDRILHGELRAGEALPSERILTELLGVNRGAVREGLKRLQQARLIQVRHGGATQVLDWRQQAGLEMLPSLLLDQQGQLNLEVARGIMLLRQNLAPALAQQAAASPRNTSCAEALRTTLKEMQAQASLQRLQELSLTYWAQLVEGADNLAFRLAFNSLRQTYERIAPLLTQVMRAEFADTETLKHLASAIASGDQSTARELAEAHVSKGQQAIEALLAAYPTNGDS